ETASAIKGCAGRSGCIESPRTNRVALYTTAPRRTEHVRSPVCEKCSRRRERGFGPAGCGREYSDARTQIHRKRDRKAAGRNPPARASLLRVGRAENQRRGVRPADEPAE